jgi:hypothetical protein
MGWKELFNGEGAKQSRIVDICGFLRKDGARVGGILLKRTARWSFCVIWYVPGLRRGRFNPDHSIIMFLNS